MGMSARTSIVTLLFAPLLGAQAPATAENDTPVVVRFVAPAYPNDDVVHITVEYNGQLYAPQVLTLKYSGKFNIFKMIH